MASGEVYDIKNLVERLPEEEQDDVDAVMNLMDWEANVDPHYKKHYFRPPVMDLRKTVFMRRNGSPMATPMWAPRS